MHAVPVVLFPEPEAESRADDHVLAVPAAQEWSARDGKHADQHRDRGDLHLGEEAAHLPQVLLVMAAVDDAAGTQEQERLEEGVREEVQQPGNPAADTQRQHHVAELRAGREREYALDVRLNQRDRGADEERDRADVRDGEQHFRREQGEGPAHEIDAGGDHRRRVDQGADRRRAFHRVWEPRLQRHLSALPDATHEDAEAHDHEQPVGHGPVAEQVGLCGNGEAAIVVLRVAEPVDVARFFPQQREQSDMRTASKLFLGRQAIARVPGLINFVRRVRAHDSIGEVEPAMVVAFRRANAAIHLFEVQGAEEAPGEHDADEEPGVADAVDDERLVGRPRSRRSFVVEPDEEERTDADQFPTHEHLKQVVRDQEVEHREAEQR